MYKTKEQTEKQCLYCGNVPKAVEAGFAVNELPLYAVTGLVKYHWTCNECAKENYYTQQEDPRDVKGLMETFERYYPNMFSKEQVYNE